MNNDYLMACQIISSMQENLIKIEIALSNKTMSVDIAKKHIKQIVLLAEGVEKQLNNTKLTDEIKTIAKSLMDKTKISYSVDQSIFK